MTQQKKDRAVLIGTAGHVDHGKTSLVKALTGTDTDRLKEEKRRGLSIVLGFAEFTLPGGRVCSMIDVPGHEKFIKTMLSGVSAIELVLFCVAADDGVMPQTLEHLEIVNLLGVNKGLFVLTKTDIASPERINEVRSQIRKLTERTLLKDCSIIEASVVTGTGVEEVREELARLCSQGGEGLNEGNTEVPVDKGYMRLPVDRSFVMKGFGCVVTGTVVGGALRRSEDVFLYPGGARLRVRGIQTRHKQVEVVKKGERAAVNISGISATDVSRGDVLVSEGLWKGMTLAHAQGHGSSQALIDSSSMRVFDCVIDFLSSMPHEFKNGAALTLHHQTSEARALIRLLGMKKAGAGQKAFARVKLETPHLMLKGDRFILRDAAMNRTVAGGCVLMVHVQNTKKTLRLQDVDFPALESGDISSVLDFIISPPSVRGRSRGSGPTVKDFCLSMNIREDELEHTLREQTQSEYFIFAKRVVSAEIFKAVQRGAVDALASFHKERPGESGVKPDELEKRATALLKDVLSHRAVGQFFESGVMDVLISEGLVKRHGATYALASHSPALNEADSKVREGIVRLLGTGFEVTRNVVLEELNFSKSDIERTLKYMTMQGEAVKLKPGAYMSGHAVNEALDKLEKYFADGNKFIKLAEFKNLLGCGRRLCIELLEYFDAVRVTVRNGDERTLR